MGTVVGLVPQELDVVSSPNVSQGRDGVEMASVVVKSLTTPDRGVAGSSPAVEAGGMASLEVSLPAGQCRHRRFARLCGLRGRKASPGSS